MLPSEVIREARNLLFEKGWTKHTVRDGVGALCLVGAVSTAKWGNARSTKSCSVEVAYLTEALRGVRWPGQHHGGSVVGFNDDHRTEFDDVVSLLDRAEKIAERDEA